MKSGLFRYVAVTSSIIGVAGALGLCAMQSSAHAQTTAKAPSATKLEPTPKVLTGTLFNTHEQRERLDRARQRGGVPEDEVVAVAEPERSVINGFVKRSDGRNTVWVDDVMKRDPRSEVVEQLEPNVVGSIVGGRARLATNTVTVNSTARKQTYKKAVAKKRLQKIRRKLTSRL